jgi:hypothetical protein
LAITTPPEPANGVTHSDPVVDDPDLFYLSVAAYAGELDAVAVPSIDSTPLIVAFASAFAPLTESVTLLNV